MAVASVQETGESMQKCASAVDDLAQKVCAGAAQLLVPACCCSKSPRLACFVAISPSCLFRRESQSLLIGGGRGGGGGGGVRHRTQCTLLCCAVLHCASVCLHEPRLTVTLSSPHPCLVIHLLNAQALLSCCAVLSGHAVCAVLCMLSCTHVRKRL